MLISVIRFSHDGGTITRRIAYSFDNGHVVAPGLSEQELTAFATYVHAHPTQRRTHGASLDIMTEEEYAAYEQLVSVMKAAYEQEIEA